MPDDYDNTDRGVAFPPHQTQKFILQGTINSGGDDRRCVIVKDVTKTGKVIRKVYAEVGILFENDKRGNDSAPDYTGNFLDRRIAGWKKVSQNGNPFMSFSVSDKKEDGSDNSASPANKDIDDDIPF